jgi:hypothetical protein
MQVVYYSWIVDVGAADVDLNQDLARVAIQTPTSARF